MTRLILTALLAVLIASTSQSKEANMQPSTEVQLLEATQNHNIEKVRSLLKQKIALDNKDSQGRTALLIATRNNDIEIAKLLLEAGADVNIQDQIQDSPLLYAGAAGRLEILKMILKSKPNFKIYNRFGGTALIPAAEKGHIEVVKELVKTPIDINHVNNLGWTALMEAVVLSDGGPVHQQIIRVLIEAGADVNIPDRDKVTALTHAKKKGFKEITALLEKSRSSLVLGQNSFLIFQGSSHRLAKSTNGVSFKVIGGITGILKYHFDAFQIVADFLSGRILSGSGQNRV